MKKILSKGHTRGSRWIALPVLALAVLLVQRRVPSSRRPSRTNLKNISNRNAVASSQMRLGLLVRHDIRLKSELPTYFADVLARELSTDISAADSDTATAAPQPTPAR